MITKGQGVGALSVAVLGLGGASTPKLPCGPVSAGATHELGRDVCFLLNDR